MPQTFIKGLRFAYLNSIKLAHLTEDPIAFEIKEISTSSIWKNLLNEFSRWVRYHVAKMLLLPFWVFIFIAERSRTLQIFPLRLRVRFLSSLVSTGGASHGHTLCTLNPVCVHLFSIPRTLPRRSFPNLGLWFDIKIQWQVNMCLCHK